jgi:hypothetical protein
MMMIKRADTIDRWDVEEAQEPGYDPRLWVVRLEWAAQAPSDGRAPA